MFKQESKRGNDVIVHDLLPLLSDTNSLSAFHCRRMKPLSAVEPLWVVRLLLKAFSQCWQFCLMPGVGLCFCSQLVL